MTFHWPTRRVHGPAHEIDPARRGLLFGVAAAMLAQSVGASPFRLHVRGKSPGAPPAGLSHGNDGTGSKPAGAIDVTTATINAAIAARGTNTTLYLAPGNYGVLSFGFSDYNGLTLYGQTGVNVDYITVGNGAHGLACKYMTIGLADGTGSIHISGDSHHLDFDHITVAQTAYTTAATRVAGFYLRDGHDITFTHFHLDGVANGIGTLGDDGGDATHLGQCYNITFADGTIEKYLENAVFMTNTQQFTFVRVRIRNEDVTVGGHADFVQLTGCRHGLLQDVYGEVLIGFKDLQGIGGSTETCDDITYSRCCSWLCGLNGASISACTNFTIDDCFYQGCSDLAGDYNGGSRILIRTQSDNVTVTNNWADGFGQADAPPPTNLTPVGLDATHLGSNTLIATATSATDSALRDAWLALHLTVPHW